MADKYYMIDRGILTQKRPKPLASESVHGLPIHWPEQSAKATREIARREPLLATQNVHGLPTMWDELDLSE